jgi:EAL domain-containing protein (putative c-di-GMP-specific phosphodiesterase class I)
MWVWRHLRGLGAPGAVVLGAATLLFAAVIVAVGLASAASQRGDARMGSIDEAEARLDVLASFAPGLTRDGGLGSAERRSLDASWQRLAADRAGRSLRVWRADGSLLYRAPGDHIDHAAPFTPGSIPRHPWSAQRQSPRLLEVYKPVVIDGRVRAVVELAQPLGPLLGDEAAQGRQRFWRVLARGTVLWLALLPVLLQLAPLAGRAWDPRRRLLLRRVRRAMAAGELEVHYQPKVTIAAGELDGVEALVRWRRDGRLVAPGSFLPAVEEGGLIRDLTLFVLDTAMSDARRWEREGLQIGIAVNLAPVSLNDPRLVDDVAAALRKHDMEAGRLTLEVTETAVIDDDEGAGQMLQRLAHLGVCLSVDDFGTGHSSLARLTRHPFSELKIDRSFVMELTSQHRPIVATLIRLARTLELRVVAEGVEDDATLNALRAQGCDVAQGYLLGRPMPASELVAVARAMPEITRPAMDVRSLLDTVREALQLDAAFIAEFVEDAQVFRVASGDSDMFAIHEGTSQALCDSYCARVVDGVFPNLLADTQRHPGARQLPVTQQRGIGAYVGIPLHRPDGSLYGTLCGLTASTRPDLGADDVATLKQFGRQVSPLLDSAHLAVSVPAFSTPPIPRCSTAPRAAAARPATER